VLATRHGAVEIGACSLPEGSYSVLHPVALGDKASLQSLKFNPDLCGHILTIDCGNGPLDIIVMNSNLGGGLDLYASSWAIATNNKPPGETSCSVTLTSKNPLTNSNSPICYHATGEVNNQYYHNVGLLNVGSRITTGATLNGVQGAHRGANPYYAFDVSASGNDQVVFRFQDGTTQSVFLRDCLNGAQKHMWS
jgi:hypothetical protein